MIGRRPDRLNTTRVFGESNETPYTSLLSLHPVVVANYEQVLEDSSGEGVPLVWLKRSASPTGFFSELHTILKEKVDDVGQNGKMLQALGGHSAPDHTDDLECVLTRPGFSPHSSIPLILLSVLSIHNFGKWMLFLMFCQQCIVLCFYQLL